MEELEQSLKVGFIEEAAELLNNTEECFLKLEHSPSDTKSLEEIFRLAHSLKGSAKAVGFEFIGTFTHELESLLLKIKHKEIEITPPIVTLLLNCNDHLKVTMDTLKNDLSAQVDGTHLIQEIQRHLNGEASHTPEQPPENPEVPAYVNDLQNEIAKLVQDQMRESEPSLNSEISQMIADETEKRIQEMLHFQQNTHAATEDSTPAQPAENLTTTAPVLQVPQTPATPNDANSPNNAAANEHLRVSLHRLDRLLNFIGELVILQAVLNEQSNSLQNISVKKTVQQLGKVAKEVQEISMSLRMVSLKQLFQKMQRIVRDTANVLNKKINLNYEGEENEIDKTVLDKISDPLSHMIRNAVDHGIEHPEERIKKGKEETGTIHLKAYHQSGRLIVEIQDDGAGMDAELLLKKAIEKGLLKPGTRLGEQECLQLIFLPGFSTKTQVTDISGRGVGMDVVKTNITQLQGDIQISTELGKGSTFKIALPLTLAIVDALIVQSAGDKFVIPLGHVHEAYRPTHNDLQYLTGIGEVLLLRGETIPIYQLNKLLNSPSTSQGSQDEKIALICRLQKEPFAILVDDILGQNQIVIKTLGPEVKNIKGFSGSAILGDGRPALILEISDLIRGRTASSSTRLNENRRIAT